VHSLHLVKVRVAHAGPLRAYALPWRRVCVVRPRSSHRAKARHSK
jgi:hypothetical protein